MKILRPYRRTGVFKKCLICNKEFFKNLCRLKMGKGKYCSKKCYGISKKGKPNWNKGLKLGQSKFRGKLRPELSGKNHWNWRGGVASYYIRTSNIEWKNLRKIVYKRDNWICQYCGKHCYEDIQCHHRIPWRISYDNSMNNLITLCIPCHNKVESEFRKKENIYGI